MTKNFGKLSGTCNIRFNLEGFLVDYWSQINHTYTNFQHYIFIVSFFLYVLLLKFKEIFKTISFISNSVILYNSKMKILYSVSKLDWPYSQLPIQYLAISVFWKVYLFMLENPVSFIISPNSKSSIQNYSTLI